jgi:hypothetical protein
MRMRNYSNQNSLTNYCWEIRNCPSVLQTMYCFIIQIEVAGVTFVIAILAMEDINVLRNAIMINALSAIKKSVQERQIAKFKT